MGNTLSEEEETQILEEAYTMSLEDPEADKTLNSGTAAPNCQPKHSQREADDIEQREDDENPNADPRFRNSNDSGGQEDRRKRQHADQQMEAAQQQKRLSYIQMARLGYQELVNAIIRPPRADYKVC